MYSHVLHQTNQPVLAISHLSVFYDGTIEALHDATFRLHTGDLVAVVGPNGAGKSSLFKALVGIHTDIRGEIQVYGSQPGRHVCIAFLPQRSHFDWSFPVTVADVVMMGRIAKLGLFGWPKKADWEMVYQVLSNVGIADLEKRQISQLSGGQQQRMLIARAMAQNAELILMDEPLAGLDTPSQEDILSLLGDLKHKKITIMVATHDLDQAVNFFDQILLINKRIISFGPAEVALTPETLSQAYGGRLRISNGKIIPDTCCDGDQHD